MQLNQTILTVLTRGMHQTLSRAKQTGKNKHMYYHEEILKVDASAFTNDHKFR